MDRTLYKATFSKQEVPAWTCPICRKGTLKLLEDSLTSRETSLSASQHAHDAWWPDFIQYVYSCMFQCSTCKDWIASSGVGGVSLEIEIDHHGEPDQVWSDYFRPRFFEPPLAVIDLPLECPETVSAPIVESFRLFFCSPASAANHVRIALEELLTELGVRRFIVKRSKRQLLSLHSRIGMLDAKYSHLRDLFLAIKWLGNAGSHAQVEVTNDDVLDAYELVNHVLEELYAHKTKKVKAIAKRVNKKKGPTKATTRNRAMRSKP